MFKNSIDNKEIYYDSLENPVLDLGEPIFDKNYGQSCVFSFYKLSESMEMRPDLASIGMYGTDEYTEMVLKYAGIDNPFTVEKDDLLLLPSLNTINNDVRPVIMGNDSANVNRISDAIKNYHKYIDPSKAPKAVGSQSNNISDKVSNNISDKVLEMSGAEQIPAEANISQTGASGVTIKNGKLYFGETGINSPVDDITDIDNTNKTASDLVDCARNGVTIGQFLDLTTKNILK